MVSQSIITKIPSCSKVYIFGSVLYSTSPTDLDILAVYDEHHCSPSDAYGRHKELVKSLSEFFRLPVHITLLTIPEEQEVGFIERSYASPILLALRVLAYRYAGTSNL